ncbi:hypothetical protein [Mycolicibacterium sp. YH-1]|uniref:hypothetical protein n=1 Tax=Mycolicibacterium sp. YH-1 TaxID=2908837 RepID=UPI001F4BF807|nr:hypothetical protein [Mycolicibacterium sp. YH-1]UNB54088.1 hypothetical protein L0M16_07050 [Mycolicibacterium sp. YH-1]
MRSRWAVTPMVIATAGVLGAALATAGVAGADEESASEVISRLQSEGYTVTLDKIGTGPIESCTVSSVRNPQSVSQLVPYVGPGLGGDRILVPQTNQTVSVSLIC